MKYLVVYLLGFLRISIQFWYLGLFFKYLWEFFIFSKFYSWTEKWGIWDFGVLNSNALYLLYFSSYWAHIWSIVVFSNLLKKGGGWWGVGVEEGDTLAPPEAGRSNISSKIIVISNSYLSFMMRKHKNMWNFFNSKLSQILTGTKITWKWPHWGSLIVILTHFFFN